MISKVVDVVYVWLNCYKNFCNFYTVSKMSLSNLRTKVYVENKCKLHHDQIISKMQFSIYCTLVVIVIW